MFKKTGKTRLRVRLLLISTTLASLTLLTNLTAQAEPRLIDKIVAVVGGEALMASELQQRIQQANEQQV